MARENFPDYVPKVGTILRFEDGSESMVIARWRTGDLYNECEISLAGSKVTVLRFNDQHQKPSRRGNWREMECEVVE